MYRFVRHAWGASKSMTKDEYFKLCPTLVQEQVYMPGSLHHLLSALGSPPPPPPPPRMADATFLTLNWSIARKKNEK